jgi:hypothetical protein
MELPRSGLTRRQRRASKSSKGRKSLAVIILAGKEYEVRRFNIGELKQMTAAVDASDNVVERSRELIGIALARQHPEVTIDDKFETDMAELNAAAAVIIDVAGFIMLGKQRAAAVAAASTSTASTATSQ